MRLLTCLLILFCVLCSMPARAQVEMTIPDAGRVKTIAKVENGILGISNSYMRLRGTGRECVGACFYTAATRTGRASY